MLKFAKAFTALGVLAGAAAFSPAQAQETKVAIGISGWTGFAPLTLAKEAGIYKANGLDVTIKKIPQKDRHLAIASGDLQCAATTVETWIVWNTNGIATTQLFKMDQGMGSDGTFVVLDITARHPPMSCIWDKVISGKRSSFSMIDESRLMRWATMHVGSNLRARLRSPVWKVFSGKL